MSYNESRMKRVWKKTALVIVLALAVTACVFALTACGVAGVSSERDLYGDYYTEDYSRCLTLSENNTAVLGIGADTSETYYAKYNFGGRKIELRDGGKRGDVKYTLKIEDADTLVVEIDEYIYNENNEIVKSGEKITITFNRE